MGCSSYQLSCEGVNYIWRCQPGFLTWVAIFLGSIVCVGIWMDTQISATPSSQSPEPRSPHTTPSWCFQPSESNKEQSADEIPLT
jgi:hypothetical protein